MGVMVPRWSRGERGTWGILRGRFFCLLGERAVSHHPTKTLHKKQLLIPVPVILLKGVSLLAGKYKDVQKITEPLVVDSYESAKIMNWSPIYTPEEGVKDAVDFYLKHSI